MTSIMTQSTVRSTNDSSLNVDMKRKVWF